MNEPRPLPGDPLAGSTLAGYWVYGYDMPDDLGGGFVEPPTRSSSRRRGVQETEVPRPNLASARCYWRVRERAQISAVAGFAGSPGRLPAVLGG